MKTNSLALVRLPVDRRRTSRAFRLYLLQQHNGPGKRDYRVLLARSSLLLADRTLVHSGSGAVRGGVAVDVADPPVKRVGWSVIRLVRALASETKVNERILMGAVVMGVLIGRFSTDLKGN